MVLETVDGKIRAHRGSAENPDAVLAGPPRLIIGVLSGRVDLDDARREGLEFDGDPKIVSRVRSTPAPATVR
jgi:hypothetical protein